MFTLPVEIQPGNQYSHIYIVQHTAIHTDCFMYRQCHVQNLHMHAEIKAWYFAIGW